MIKISNIFTNVDSIITGNRVMLFEKLYKGAVVLVWFPGDVI